MIMTKQDYINFVDAIFDSFVQLEPNNRGERCTYNITQEELRYFVNDYLSELHTEQCESKRDKQEKLDYGDEEQLFYNEQFK